MFTRFICLRNVPVVTNANTVKNNGRMSCVGEQVLASEGLLFKLLCN